MVDSVVLHYLPCRHLKVTVTHGVLNPSAVGPPERCTHDNRFDLSLYSFSEVGSSGMTVLYPVPEESEGEGGVRLRLG